VRLVDIWNGNGYYLKTYQGNDGYYHTVITTPDFTTQAEASNFQTKFIDFTKGNRA